MNEFKSVKVPEYIKHIKSYPEINFDAALNTTYGVGKIAVQIAETTDNLIVDCIKEIAEKEGITDLYILDKQNIVAALEKQIPKKPYKVKEHKQNDYYCVVCNRYLGDEMELKYAFLQPKYCRNCGQALDWGIKNENN